MHQNHLGDLLKQGLLGPGVLHNLQGSVQSKNVGGRVEKLSHTPLSLECCRTAQVIHSGSQPQTVLLLSSSFSGSQLGAENLLF